MRFLNPHKIFRKLTAAGLVAVFFLQSAIPACAQSLLNLPTPGVRVSLSPSYTPAILRGVKVFPDNPFKFDFILDHGDAKLPAEDLKKESTKLIKYFLASLTTPENDLWVNLSPHEQDRIIPPSFGTTEMGRDLLAQDYLLKQVTASIIYPEEDMGKKFWGRVYQQAYEKFGTTDIPVNTFNKVWVVPEKAVVYEHGDTALVTKTRLKVMLEEDYVALSHQKDSAESPAPGGDLDIKMEEGTHAFGSNIMHNGQTDAEHDAQVNALGSQIIREVIIPELEREVNEGKNFVELRQVYNSLILATWYKKKLKDSILSKVYADQNKTAGIALADKDEAKKIYDQYLTAFKKGVYNYIKEDYDLATKETVPRKYFSGGFGFEHMPAVVSVTTNPVEAGAAEALGNWGLREISYISEQNNIISDGREMSPKAADDAMLAVNQGFTAGERQYWLRYPEQMVSELLKDSGNTALTVLDLGSASGGISMWTARQNPRFQVIGYERSADAVNTAQRQAKEQNIQNVAFVEANIVSGIPRENESVDAVILHKLRDSFPTPAMRRQLLKEVARVLKPDGWVSVVEDLFVEPGDQEGDWYGRRYALHAQILPELTRRGLVDPVFQNVAAENPDFHPLISLRTAQGGYIDELQFVGRESQLIEKIAAKEMIVRGIGVHQEAQSVIKDFATEGLRQVQRWDVVMPELPGEDRGGHSTVMKGILFEKNDHAMLSDFVQNYLTVAGAFDDAAYGSKLGEAVTAFVKAIPEKYQTRKLLTQLSVILGSIHQDLNPQTLTASRSSIENTARYYRMEDIAVDDIMALLNVLAEQKLTESELGAVSELFSKMISEYKPENEALAPRSYRALPFVDEDMLKHLISSQSPVLVTYRSVKSGAKVAVYANSINEGSRMDGDELELYLSVDGGVSEIRLDVSFGSGRSSDQILGTQAALAVADRAELSVQNFIDQQGTNAVTAVAQKFAEGYRFVLAGEQHSLRDGTPQAQRYLIDLLPALKKSGVTHLFLEDISQDFNRTVDSLRAVFKRRGEEGMRDYWENAPTPLDSPLDLMRREVGASNIDWMVEAFKNDIEVVGINLTQKQYDQAEQEDPSLDFYVKGPLRDRISFEFIEQFLASHPDSKGFIYGGMGHYYKGHGETLMDMLSAKYRSLSLFMAAQNTFPSLDQAIAGAKLGKAPLFLPVPGSPWAESRINMTNDEERTFAVTDAIVVFPESYQAGSDRAMLSEQSQKTLEKIRAYLETISGPTEIQEIAAALQLSEETLRRLNVRGLIDEVNKTRSDQGVTAEGLIQIPKLKTANPREAAAQALRGMVGRVKLPALKKASGVSVGTLLDFYKDLVKAENERRKKEEPDKFLLALDRDQEREAILYALPKIEGPQTAAKLAKLLGVSKVALNAQKIGGLIKAENERRLTEPNRKPIGWRFVSENPDAAIQDALKTLEGKITVAKIAQVADLNPASVSARDYNSFISAENGRRQREAPQLKPLELERVVTVEKGKSRDLIAAALKEMEGPITVKGIAAKVPSIRSEVTIYKYYRELGVLENKRRQQQEPARPLLILPPEVIDAPQAIVSALETMEGQVTARGIAHKAEITTTTLNHHDYRKLIEEVNAKRKKDTPERPAIIPPPVDSTREETISALKEALKDIQSGLVNATRITEAAGITRGVLKHIDYRPLVDEENERRGTEEPERPLLEYNEKVKKSEDPLGDINNALRTWEGTVTLHELAEKTNLAFMTLKRNKWRSLTVAENIRRAQEEPGRALLTLSTRGQTDDELLVKSKFLDEQIDKYKLEDVISGTAEDLEVLIDILMLLDIQLPPSILEAIAVHSYRGLRAQPTDTLEEKEYSGYQETQDGTVLDEYPEQTEASFVEISGRLPGGFKHLQVAGDRNRIVDISGDGRFSFRVILPKGKEVHLDVFGFDDEAKTRSLAQVLTIKQTSQKITPEEVLVNLLEQREDLRRSIQEKPEQLKYVAGRLELGLLLDFTEDENTGMKQVDAKIEKARASGNALMESIYKGIKEKFEAIRKMNVEGFRLTDDRGQPQKIYFFQKYVIQEVRQRIAGVQAKDPQALPGVILALEQGLGKTVVGLVLMRMYEEGALAFVPNAVAESWAEAEGKFFEDQESKVIAHGSHQARAKELDSSDLPINVMTFEFLRSTTFNRFDVMNKNPQQLLLFDESQSISNPESLQSQGAANVRGAFTMLMSGTPLVSVGAVRTVIQFLEKNNVGLSDARVFSSLFNKNDPDSLRLLHFMMKKYTLRIKARHVFKEYDPNVPLDQQTDRLPAKVDVDPKKLGVFPLKPSQEESILDLFTNWDSWVDHQMAHGLKTDQDQELQQAQGEENYFSKLHALLQIMTFTDYTDQDSTEENPKQMKLDEIVDLEVNKLGGKVLISAKYNEEIRRYAEHYRATGLGVVTFYGETDDEFDTQGDFIANADGQILNFKRRNIHDFLIGPDGKPIVDERAGDIDDPNAGPLTPKDYNRLVFQNDPNTKIMITNDTTGGVGVTFTAANATIRTNRGRNAAIEEQFDKRINRIDNVRKKYETRHYTLVAEHSPEFLERMKSMSIWKSVDPQSGSVQFVRYVPNAGITNEMRQNPNYEFKTLFDEYFKQGTYDEVQQKVFKSDKIVLDLILGGFQSEHNMEEFDMARVQQRFPGLLSNGAQSDRAMMNLTEDSVKSDGAMLTNLNGKKILVVDDDPSIQRATARGIRIDGAEVETANNGKEALEKMRQNKYDMIVSDIQMPEMNGVDLVRQTKTEFPGQKIVLVSAMDRSDLDEYEQELGVRVFTKGGLTELLEGLYKELSSDRAMMTETQKAIFEWLEDRTLGDPQARVMVNEAVAGQFKYSTGETLASEALTELLTGVFGMQIYDPSQFDEEKGEGLLTGFDPRKVLEGFKRRLDPNVEAMLKRREEESGGEGRAKPPEILSSDAPDTRAAKMKQALVQAELTPLAEGILQAVGPYKDQRVLHFGMNVAGLIRAELLLGAQVVNVDPDNSMERLQRLSLQSDGTADRYTSRMLNADQFGPENHFIPGNYDVVTAVDLWGGYGLKGDQDLIIRNALLNVAKGGRLITTGLDPARSLNGAEQIKNFLKTHGIEAANYTVRDTGLKSDNGTSLVEFTFSDDAYAQIQALVDLGIGDPSSADDAAAADQAMLSIPVEQLTKDQPLAFKYQNQNFLVTVREGKASGSPRQVMSFDIFAQDQQMFEHVGYADFTVGKTSAVIAHAQENIQSAEEAGLIKQIAPDSPAFDFDDIREGLGLWLKQAYRKGGSKNFRGLGELLMRLSGHVLKRSGVKAVHVESASAATGFYENLGAKRNTKGYYVLPLDSGDKAMMSADEVGGIDFSNENVPLEVDSDGPQLKFTFDPAEIENLKIDGFVPVILDIKPVKDLPMLLGIKDENVPQQLTMAK